ncbi:hypothetical protein KKF84_03860 [Myxococcota bacterium]|nr:hypothetical protein [Myxococcota bacterium]MBU1534429.1 hypothetical protein [Myxococcota bacterium]
MKTLKATCSLIIAAFLVLAPTVVSAQEGGKVVQSLDLGSEALDGELLGPDQGFMSARKISIMNSLIQFRDDFIAEMIKSAEDL